VFLDNDGGFGWIGLQGTNGLILAVDSNDIYKLDNTVSETMKHESQRARNPNSRREALLPVVPLLYMF
jgi:hypothetical protein